MAFNHDEKSGEKRSGGATGAESAGVASPSRFGFLSSFFATNEDPLVYIDAAATFREGNDAAETFFTEDSFLTVKPWNPSSGDASPQWFPLADHLDRAFLGETIQEDVVLPDAQGNLISWNIRCFPVGEDQGGGFLLQLHFHNVQPNRAVHTFSSSVEAQRVIESIPLFIVALDEHKNIVYWNNECARVTGYGASEICNNPKAMKTLYPDRDYRARMLAAWENHSDADRDWEWAITCKDGTQRVIAWSSISDYSPVADWSMWGVGIDVTAQHEAAQNFNYLAESVNQAFWLRTREKVHFVSPAYNSLWGMPCSAFETAPESMLEAIHPDDRDRVSNAIDSGLDQGEASELEFRLGKTGSTCRWIFMRTFPVPIGERREAGLIGVAEDITQDKQILTQLRESESKFNHLLNSIEDGVWSADFAVSMVHFINPAFEAIYGRNVTDFQANPTLWLEAVHPEDRHIAVASRRELNASGRSQSEYRIRRPDGEIRWISDRKSIIYDDDNIPVSVGGIVADITEAKTVALQAEQSQKLEGLGLLAGGVAHDFNNLLLGIIGYADLALADIPGHSAAGQYVRTILETAQRAAELCNQLLIYSGKGDYNAQSLDLSGLVLDMNQLALATVAKKIVITFNCPDDLPPVEGDPVRLRQILLNLITNASDAIGDAAGEIAIQTSVEAVDGELTDEVYRSDNFRPGKHVCFQVSDTGCGMDERTRRSLFEPFFTTKPTGHGLGLAAVLGIVGSHRGAIVVESECDKGSCIRVYVPSTHKRPTPVKPHVPRDTPWRGSGTILVIDDEAVVRNLSSKILENVGFATMSAENGREGLACFREHHHKLSAVILDLTMPHMDGSEAYAEIRRIDKHMPLLISTGFSQENTMPKFANDPKIRFLQKPYRAVALLEKIRELVKLSSPQN